MFRFSSASQTVHPMVIVTIVREWQAARATTPHELRERKREAGFDNERPVTREVPRRYNDEGL